MRTVRIWTMVSSDEEDFVNSDDGSMTDFNWDMSEEEELMGPLRIVIVTGQM